MLIVGKRREEGRGKREEGRGKREEGRGKREEGRGKREEGRGKREGEGSHTTLWHPHPHFGRE
jgi:hypothetical protein